MPAGARRASGGVLARDAALDRVRRTRRWVIAGTAALTAGFAALVSAVAPGHSLASKSRPATSAHTGSTTSAGLPAMPAPANPGVLGLQGPGRAPSPVPEQPQSIPSQPPPDQSQSTPSQPPSGGGDGSVVSGGS